MKPVGLLLLLFLFSTARSAAAETTVRTVDFEDAPLGRYSAETLRAEWGTTSHPSALRRNRVAVTATRGGDKVLAVRYPLRCTDHTVWKSPLPPADEYYLDYSVYVPATLAWTTRGTLPGLAGGTAPLPGSDGGGGFTSRPMWEARPDPQVLLHTLWRGMLMKFGDERPFRAFWRKGRWQRVRQYVRLNTPGRDDGALAFWVDGKKLYDGTPEFRGPGEEWKIDTLFFHTYFGLRGPQKEETIYFDDFKVSAR